MPAAKSKESSMFSEPRTVYLFRCSANWKRHAATLDRKGSNLPNTSCQGGTWRFLESHRISDATTGGVADDAMRASLASEGFFVWDAPAAGHLVSPAGKAA
jgi:hypothetical protein